MDVAQSLPELWNHTVELRIPLLSMVATSSGSDPFSRQCSTRTQKPSTTMSMRLAKDPLLKSLSLHGKPVQPITLLIALINCSSPSLEATDSLIIEVSCAVLMPCSLRSTLTASSNSAVFNLAAVPSHMDVTKCVVPMLYSNYSLHSDFRASSKSADPSLTATPSHVKVTSCAVLMLHSSLSAFVALPNSNVPSLLGVTSNGPNVGTLMI